MGCQNAKQQQLKKKLDYRFRSSSTMNQIQREEELKNEILLLRNCLFEVLDMKNSMKSLVSIQQDICLIKMKKRNEENLEEIIRCYENNVMQRAIEINRILNQKKEIKSDTSLMHHESQQQQQNQQQPPLPNLKNIKSIVTNCNSINDSALFIQKNNYDVYHVLRYCSSLNYNENQSEQQFNFSPIQINNDDNNEYEHGVIEFQCN